MKNLITVLALCVPLVAQDVVPEQETKQDKTNVEQREHRKSFGKRVWMGVQDAEWKKFDAAHRRAHSKRGEHAGREYRGKKHKARRLVRLVVVGGLAYYIGYHEGEKHSKGWDKRRYGGRK